MPFLLPQVYLNQSHKECDRSYQVILKYWRNVLQ